MDTYDKIIGMMRQAENVGIYMHVNSDCDCIGSAIALAAFLKKDGKNASFFSQDLKTTDMLSKKYAFLPFFDEFNRCNCTEFDLSVAVDTGDAGRLGDVAYKQFLKAKQRIVIDHHEILVDFVKVTLREAGAASTTQILYKLMARYDESLIDKDIATLLFAGLVTDSGGFSFENCTEETFFVASKLVSYGIDNNDVYEKLMKTTAPNVYALRNMVLSDTTFYENGKIGVIVFTSALFAKTGTQESDTDGIVNFVREVSGVEVAISVAEVGEKRYKVSFRTKEYVNAAICAKCFGGGGHVRAAGCRVNGYLDDVLEKILKVATERLHDRD